VIRNNDLRTIKPQFYEDFCMSQLKINFGKRLQALRLEAEMTQDELAGEIGVTVESTSNIERGVFGPKFDNLEKIANVLGVPVKELFYFDA